MHGAYDLTPRRPLQDPIRLLRAPRDEFVVGHELGRSGEDEFHELRRPAD